MIYTDGLKHYCYLILADIIVNFKEQVFITKIEANLHWYDCYVSLQKQKNLTKILLPQTYKLTWLQLKKYKNNAIKQQDKV